ncbi:hypothetical protein LA6_003546 [Marinibacterium anthonyi]|nr:hypothetical protein LA6_003546 [Marinibacterium anthonyi]
MTALRKPISATGVRGGTGAIGALLALLVIPACTGLPETAAGVERPLTYDGTEYKVSYSMQAVAEKIAVPGGADTTASFDATFIEIARADGQPMDGDDRLGTIAIASAFCDTYGLPRAPVSGKATYYTSTRSWRVRNHCGTAFG